MITSMGLSLKCAVGGMVLVAVAFWLQAEEPSFRGNIDLEVQGLRSHKGKLLVSLFAQAKGFPDEHANAFRSLTLTITNETMGLTFTNLPAGSYALALCHDENADGQMNKKSFGRPREGHAVYRPQNTMMRPPSFGQSMFVLQTNAVRFAVKMVYPE